MTSASTRLGEIAATVSMRSYRRIMLGVGLLPLVAAVIGVSFADTSGGWSVWIALLIGSLTGAAIAAARGARIQVVSYALVSAVLTAGWTFLVIVLFVILAGGV